MAGGCASIAIDDENTSRRMAGDRLSKNIPMFTRRIPGWIEGCGPSVTSMLFAVANSIQAEHSSCRNSNAEVQPNHYIVRDANREQLAYVYYENEPGRRSAAKLLTKDEARRIAANIAKLAELLAAKRAT